MSQDFAMTLQTGSDPLQLNDLSDIQISYLTLGPDRTPVMVADNVFRDPYYLRRVALSFRYDLPLPGDGWPGLQSAASLERGALEDFIKRAFIEHCLDIRYGSVDYPVVREGDVPDQWSPFFMQARFGLITRSADYTPGVKIPHVDSFGFLAAVAYLSEPIRSYGGTVFCRHRETGIQIMPPSIKHLHSSLDRYLMSTRSRKIISSILDDRGFSNSSSGSSAQVSGVLTSAQEAIVWERLHGHQLRDAMQVATQSDSTHMNQDSPDWEVLNQVDMRFNRLVVYPSWQFHGINWNMSYSGSSKEEQRLTMMLWLNYPVVRTSGTDQAV